MFILTSHLWYPSKIFKLQCPNSCIKKIRNFVVRIHPICHTQTLLTCGEHLAKHSNNSEFLMHTEYFKLYSIDPSAVRYQDTFVQNSQKKILES